METGRPSKSVSDEQHMLSSVALLVVLVLVILRDDLLLARADADTPPLSSASY